MLNLIEENRISHKSKHKCIGCKIRYKNKKRNLLLLIYKSKK